MGDQQREAFSNRAKAVEAEVQSLAQRGRDLFRASPLLAVFLIALILTAMLNPAKVGLTIWGIAKLGLGGYLGYWVDRVCFRPEDRPHVLEGISKGAAWKRRAIIISAAIVAAALVP